jgi:hypothetical protein
MAELNNAGCRGKVASKLDEALAKAKALLS